MSVKRLYNFLLRSRPADRIGKQKNMVKRRNQNQMKIGAEQMALLLKCSLLLTALGLLMLGLSIYLHLESIKLLQQVEIKHHTFINKISNARVLGGAWQLGSLKRSLDGTEVAELGQQQCRHRQKTEWTYYDAVSMKSENPITVDFSASPGHMISSPSCTSSPGIVKSLKQSGEGTSTMYQCVCKADAGQLNEVHLGYEKLTCTAHYWECPVQ